MEQFDARSMAFHTSNALGFDRAHCIGNQIAACELEENANVKTARTPATVDEALFAKFQELNDAIERLRQIGSTCSFEDGD